MVHVSFMVSSVFFVDVFLFVSDETHCSCIY